MDVFLYFDVVIIGVLDWIIVGFGYVVVDDYIFGMYLFWGVVFVGGVNGFGVGVY